MPVSGRRNDLRAAAGPAAFTNILTAKLEAIFAIAQRRMFCPFSLHLSALFSFIVPYNAARRGPKQSMMHGVMAGDAPYQSTLETALGVGGRNYREGQNNR
jgi:hypothetical protein